MSKTCEFIKACSTFYVLTMDENFPTGRPFGAITEDSGKLYITTATTKAVYRQLNENPHMCLVALRVGTREWLRTKGLATECKNLSIKAKMLEEYPILHKRFDSPECPHFAVFEIEIIESCLLTDAGIERID